MPRRGYGSGGGEQATTVSVRLSPAELAMLDELAERLTAAELEGYTWRAGWSMTRSEALRHALEGAAASAATYDSE